MELADRGFTLGIASNFDRRLRLVAAGLPELRSVRHFVISSEVGWRKPAPTFFAALCRAVGHPAQHILYIGDDSVNDFEGAQAAGLRAVLLDTKSREDSSAVARIKELKELIATGD